MDVTVLPQPPRVAVIAVSDRGAAGIRDDVSGPLAVSHLENAGYEVQPLRLVSDGLETVSRALREALAEGARFVITLGGTGVSPRDLTPEATRPFLSTELPGIVEAIRIDGLTQTPFAALSRGIAGVARGVPTGDVSGEHGSVNFGERSRVGEGSRAGEGSGVANFLGAAVIVNLPGSPKAVASGLRVLLPLLPHLDHQLSGGDHG
ncbi:MogA/MoaB family molybdenum cofactor biosynthesis protein [Lysinibacter sp. HNR]|uniref:MogA/MoaB family molybdenum cofactor biosynthesis protein n=1 Tax=Lysinibacter sp. HNR TaxID=3031408 RepID=UPI002434A1BB|nr:MogA/MoaB family molybdenum cofactor biosynthesis protein [Lysinibacter sp. HNR]WGD36573.1 MogA/MoaB family molybdenum cofactor biosynthesis protein [Lysinibacter sp. HNR]